MRRPYKCPERVWWHVDGEPPNPGRTGWVEHVEGNVCHVSSVVGQPTMRVLTAHVHHADELTPVEGCAFCLAAAREPVPSRDASALGGPAPPGNADLPSGHVAISRYG
jgi:hypothetical protein